MLKIYAPEGSIKFNIELDKQLNLFSNELHQLLGNNLVALILGGGYGRGEGSVCNVNGIETGYNDLDFVLVVNNKRALNHQHLDELTEKYTEKLSIDVDLSRPLTPDDICELPHCLMWHDLLNGHKVIYGDQNILNILAPGVVKKAPPVIEATRLLLNRGSGLLWAIKIIKGQQQQEDPDFIRRNYYKCLLALGDALLISKQSYSTQCQGRDDLLIKLNLDIDYKDRIIDLYITALQFRMEPDNRCFSTPTTQELEEAIFLWEETFLYIEKQRTGNEWINIEDYCLTSFVREPEQHRFNKLPRNIIQNIKMKNLSVKYPREQLYQQLPMLLSQTKTDENWSYSVDRYLSLWQKFN
jgi:hypothetical protein